MKKAGAIVDLADNGRAALELIDKAAVLATCSKWMRQDSSRHSQSIAA